MVRTTPLALLLASLATPLRAQLEWSHVPASETRNGSRLIFDTTRQRLVGFGGEPNLNGRMALVESAGGPWRTFSTPREPVRRWLFDVAFDPALQSAVMFGGLLDGQPTSETWTWDSVIWRRRSGRGPSPRIGHAMAFDAVTQRILLFGGVDAGGTKFNDTWTWDGVGWTQLTPSTTPSPRFGHAMVDASGQILMCGGQTDTPQSGIETWRWSGSDWIRLRVANSPASRYGFALGHDPARQQTVLHGGYVPAGGRVVESRESWVLAGSTWRLASTTVPRGIGHDIAFDPTIGQLVMYGFGFSNTYVWGGTDWSIADGRSWPEPSDGSSITWDTANDRALMLARDVGSNALVWAYSGGAWSALTTIPSNLQIPVRHAGLTFDSARGVAVLVGGDHGQGQSAAIWEFDGQSFQNLASDRTPSADPLCVFDLKRNVTVIFGGVGLGFDLASTRTWDGTRLVTLPAQGPAGRSQAAGCYDPIRERVVLFGGVTTENFPRTFGDTWEWNGASWSERRPTTSPPPRYGASLVWDPARERSVLVGGTPDDGTVWEWDGQNWAARATINAPSELDDLILVHDPTQAESIAFDCATAEMWTLRPTHPAGADVFGAGCGPQPRGLSARSLPWSGRSATFEVFDASSGSTAVLWVGASRSTWNGRQLPLALDRFGMPGCSMLVAADVPIMMGSSLSASIPIPSDPVLLGTRAFAQALVMEPTLNINTTTNGLALTIGSQ